MSSKKLPVSCVSYSFFFVSEVSVHLYFSVTLTVTLLHLKPENVLVGLKKTLSESLDDIVANEIKLLSPRKILSCCTIYLSRNDFGHPKSTLGRLKTADFGAAVQGDWTSQDIHSPYPTKLLSHAGSYTRRTLVVLYGYMESQGNDESL
jgi:hypothetical protein